MTHPWGWLAPQGVRVPGTRLEGQYDVTHYFGRSYTERRSARVRMLFDIRRHCVRRPMLRAGVIEHFLTR
jgi:hypothetical protein